MLLTKKLSKEKNQVPVLEQLSEYITIHPKIGWQANGGMKNQAKLSEQPLFPHLISEVFH